MKIQKSVEDKVLEKAFLTELEALETFRITYTGMYPKVPLAKEDPDIRRLLEAMAFFSARTKLTAERTAHASLMKLFKQHFPYVLSPMPAMVMLRAKIDSRFVETSPLPRGTEIQLTRRTTTADQQTARFKTTAELKVMPITLDRLRKIVTPQKRGRFFLEFSSDFVRKTPFDELSLYVCHLNDLSASATVLHALRTHCERASIIWGDGAREDQQGIGCDLSYGAAPLAAHEFEAFEHPIQRFRAFMHFPQGEFFLTIKGIKSPASWQKFTIVLDLDEGWPADLKLTKDTFVLHAVPVINVLKEMANPIECDGTKERYLLTHPDAAEKYQAHSVLGVYKASDAGLEPIEPAVLGSDGDSYEVEYEGDETNRRAWLHLYMPGAFGKPEKIAVDAYWTQGQIADATADELSANLATRHLVGLEWECIGAISHTTHNKLEYSRDGLLSLLAMKSKKFLALDDIKFLLKNLGAGDRPDMNRLVNALKKVNVLTKPSAADGAGVCHVYRLAFDELDSSDIPKVDLLCAKLLRLLQSWNVDHVVELSVRVPRIEKELRYTE